MTNYAENNRLLLVMRQKAGKYSTFAWDSRHGEMFLPDNPLPTRNTPAEAQADLDAYARKNNLKEEAF